MLWLDYFGSQLLMLMKIRHPYCRTLDLEDKRRSGTSRQSLTGELVISNATEGCAQLHSKVPKVGPGVWSCHPLAATYTRKRLNLQLTNVRDQTLTRISPSIISDSLLEVEVQ